MHFVSASFDGFKRDDAALRKGEIIARATRVDPGERANGYFYFGDMQK